MKPNKIFYEPVISEYELGKTLLNKWKDAEWVPIDNHNNIPQLRSNPNSEFKNMKQYIIIGTRKTHKYTPNHKTSDFLVPYTSSGCSAMCLYCYLVCNYNKCSYLRLFVNREQMLAKLIKTANKAEHELTFEIGSNSDLILENTITNNLEWTIEAFSKNEKGYLTLPTKFNMVDPLLSLNHRERTIIRMSVNPSEIIRQIEIGTSGLSERITALNKLGDAGYKIGLLIAPVILLDDWKNLYTGLLKELSEKLTEKVKKSIFIEVIFMTYSYVHRMINDEAFQNAVQLYSKELMTGRGMGKYCYKTEFREEGEAYLREQIEKYLPDSPIVYIV